jgi:hypothetical protein
MRELELLYEAYHSDIGIEVEIIGNCQVIMSRLYAAKRKDPELENIQISRSPDQPDKFLWILKSAQSPARSVKQNPQNPTGEALYSLADLFGDE